MKWTRRHFVGTTSAGLVMSWPVAGSAGSRVRPSSSSSSSRRYLTDVNVSAGLWPFRSIHGDGRIETLASKLKRGGVSQAWTGSFEALFHKDLSSVNDRLVEECRTRGQGILIPFGTVNPSMPDWREEWRRCVERRGMRGIRLFPSYHGYGLDHAGFRELLGLCARVGAIVQIALLMEDERMVHPLVKLPVLDVGPLAASLNAAPGVKVVLLNSFRILRAKALLEVMAAGQVSVEISSLEGMAGIERLTEEVSIKRVLFGSNSPLLYFESALLKLRESGIEGESRERVTFGNASLLMAKG